MFPKIGGTSSALRHCTMSLWQHIKRPPWRTFALAAALFGVLGLTYIIWSPGMRVVDGRHDRAQNAIWLQHGWLGDDSWFTRNDRDPSLFRSEQRIRELADLLAAHGIRDVFPHVCPCGADGTIAPVDDVQTERFLDCFEGFRVIPWVGGVLNERCLPSSPTWRATFVSSCMALLESHPRLAGVQVNIEPMPNGDADFLILLEELREALPEGHILSVAAYPPPTRWHPFPEVHWDEEYFGQVAQRVDQIVPMMYDTGIRLPKLYQYVMAAWTEETLRWAGDTKVIFGVPTYDDAEVWYHFAWAENLRNGLRGIHAGLARFEPLPENYSGIAIYCEWEMNDTKWETMEEEFLPVDQSTANLSAE